MWGEASSTHGHGGAAALVREGLADLEGGLETMPARLVAIGALGCAAWALVLPAAQPRDNALIRRLVSVERAAECERSRLDSCGS